MISFFFTHFLNLIMIILRPATMEDLPVLYSFEQGVITAERPFASFIKEGHITYYDIAHLIQSDESEIIVAENEKRIVGVGYALIRQSKAYWKEPAFAYLGFMYVHPDFRGQGINQRIINHLKEWANSRNIQELRLEVYEGNEAAVRAYQKSGFKNHMIEMRLNLKEE